MTTYANYTANEIAALSINGVVAITAQEWVTVTPAAMSGLTAAQIAVLPVAALAAFSAAQLARVSTASLAALNVQQIAAISSAALKGLSELQKTVLAIVTFNEDSQYVFSVSTLALADSGTTVLTTTISVTQGIVKLGSLSSGVVVSGNSSASMTLVGTAAQINAALAGLTYQPNADYNGSAALTVSTTDGGAFKSSRGVAMRVMGINDAPVVGVPGAQSFNEDTVRAFSNANRNAIKVADVENGFLTTTLTTTNGKLALGNTDSGASIAGEANNSGTITLSGTAEQINAAIDGLAYTPDANYNGIAELNVTVSDGALSSTRTIALTVTPVNDASVIVARDAELFNEDTPQIFGNATNNAILVSDFDDIELTTTLTVSEGTLKLGSLPQGATITAGSDNSKTVTVSGTAAQINRAFDGLVYTPLPNANWDKTLTVAVDDRAKSLSGTKALAFSGFGSVVVLTDPGISGDVTIEVWINTNTPLSNVPLFDFAGVDALSGITTDSVMLRFDGAGRLQLCSIDDGIGRPDLWITDPTALAFGQHHIAASISKDGTGTIFVDGVNVVSGFVGGAANTSRVASYIGFSSFGNNTWFSGQMRDIRVWDTERTNAEIQAQMGTWTASAPESANAKDLKVWIPVTDTGAVTNVVTGAAAPAPQPSQPVLVAAESVVKTIQLRVLPVNDAPVITLQSSSNTLSGDTPLVFSNANKNAIAVADVDGDVLTTTFTTTNGKLALGNTSSGASIAGGANNSNTITLSGTASQINAAIDGLAYMPNTNYSGSAALTVTTSDGELNNTQTIAMTVNPVNHAPTIAIGRKKETFDEDTTLEFSSGKGNAITVADVDLQTAAVSTGLNFDGTSTSYLTLPSAKLSGDLTIEAWVNVTDDAVYPIQRFITVGSGGSGKPTMYFDLSLDHKRFTFHCPLDSSLAQSIGSKSYMTNGWHHVAVSVSSAGQATLYVDGRTDADVGSGKIRLFPQLSLNLSNAAINIGGPNFVGQIRDLRLWDVERSQAQIQTEMQTLSNPDAAGLRAWYPMNDTSGSSVANNAVVTVADGLSAGDVVLIKTPVALPNSVMRIGTLTTTLTATEGTLVLGNTQSGARIIAGADGSDSMTLNGTAAQINAAISGLIYKPDYNYNGGAELIVTTSDGLLSDTQTIELTVTPVNDAPVVKAPSDLQVFDEDTSRVFSSTNGNAITVADVDSTILTTTLTATNGKLVLGRLDSQASIIAGANSSESITLRGTADQINFALEGLVYKPNANYNGRAALTVTSSDGALSGSQTVKLTIINVDDPAVIDGDLTASLTETDAVLTTNGQLTLIDIDNSVSATPFIAQTNVAGSGKYGKFSLSNTGKWTYLTDTAHNEFVAGKLYTDTFRALATDGTSAMITVKILGTNDRAIFGDTRIANIYESDAVQTVGNTLSVTDVDSPESFVAMTNVAGRQGYGKFSISSDGKWSYTTNTAHNEFVAGTRYSESVLAYSTDGSAVVLVANIFGTNDAPVITVSRSSETFNEDADCVFSSVKGNAITVADVDSTTLTTTVTASEGTLVLRNFSSGATIKAGANNSATITLYGTSAQINSALEGLTYTPLLSASGSKTVTVTTGDGTLSDSKTITLNFIAGFSLAGWTAAQVAALTNVQVSALSFKQIGTLPSAAAAGFTQQQMPYLSSKAIAAFTAGHVSALSAMAVGALTLAQISAVSSKAIAALTAQQVSALSAVAVSALTKAQISAMPSAALIGLTAVQVSALSLTAASGLTSSTLNGFHAAAMPSVAFGLTKDQYAFTVYGVLNIELQGPNFFYKIQKEHAEYEASWIAYKKNALFALTTSQVAELAPSAIGGLTIVQLYRFSTTQLRALTPAQIEALPESQISTLTEQQISMLSASASAVLSSVDVTAFSADQLRALSNTRVPRITTSSLASLAPALMAELSTAQVQNLSASQIAVLKRAQVTAMTATQLGALSAAQVKALQLSAVRGLSKTHISAMSSVVLDSMTAAQVAELSISAVSGLTATTLAGFSTAEIPKFAEFLSLVQFSDLNKTSLDINPQLAQKEYAAYQASWVAVNATQIRSLSAAQISAIAPAALSTLTPQQMACLKRETLAALNGAQIATFSKSAISGLTAMQLTAISPAALAKLSVEQISSLTTNALSGLTSAQLFAMSPTLVKKLSTAQLSAISLDNIADFTTEQLRALSTAQWQSLSVEKMALINPKALAGLSVSEIFSIPDAQLLGLSSYHFNALSSDQVAKLEATQIAKLSPNLYADITETKLMQLTAEQRKGFTLQITQALSLIALHKLTGAQLSALIDEGFFVKFLPIQSRALNISALATLTPAAADAVVAANFQGLVQTQIAAIANDVWTRVTSTALEKMRLEAFQAITAAQVSQLTTKVVSELSYKRFSELAAAHKALEISQVGGLTPAQLNSRTSLAGLQVAGLSGTQLAKIDPDKLATLSVPQLAALTTGAIGSMLAVQLSKLPPKNLRALNIAQIAALSPAALSGLTQGQIQAMALPQLSKLTPVQKSLLNPSQAQDLKSAQTLLEDSLTVAKVIYGVMWVRYRFFVNSSTSHNNDLVQNDPIDPIDGTVRSIYYEKKAPGNEWAIYGEDINLGSFGSWKSGYRPVYSPKNGFEPSKGTYSHYGAIQFLDWDVEALLAISKYNAVEFLRADSFEKFYSLVGQGDVSSVVDWPKVINIDNLYRLASFTVGTLSAVQFKNVLDINKFWDAESFKTKTHAAGAVSSDDPFGVGFVSGLNAELFASYLARIGTYYESRKATDSTAILFSDDLFSEISEDQKLTFLSTSLEKLSTTQIQSLSFKLISGLAVTALADLAVTRPDLLKALTGVQITYISKEMIEKLTDKVLLFTPDQLISFTGFQISGITLPAAWKKIDVDITGSYQTNNPFDIDESIISSFDGDALSKLPAFVIGRLSDKTLALLNKGQLSKLTVEQVAALSGKQLGVLASSIAYLSDKVVRVLTRSQLSGLTTTPVNQASLLHVKPIVLLTASELAAVIPEEIQALAPATLASLDQSQLKALSRAQALNLLPSQIYALSKDQIAYLSSTSAACMSRTELQGVIPGEIKLLLPDTIGIFGAKQFDAMTFAQIEVLTSAQIKKIPPSVTALFSIAVWKKFSKDQYDMFDPTQYDRIDPTTAKKLATHLSGIGNSFTPIVSRLNLIATAAFKVPTTLRTYYIITTVARTERSYIDLLRSPGGYSNSDQLKLGAQISFAKFQAEGASDRELLQKGRYAGSLLAIGSVLSAFIAAGEGDNTQDKVYFSFAGMAYLSSLLQVPVNELFKEIYKRPTLVTKLANTKAAFESASAADKPAAWLAFREATYELDKFDLLENVKTQHWSVAELLTKHPEIVLGIKPPTSVVGQTAVEQVRFEDNTHSARLKTFSINGIFTVSNVFAVAFGGMSLQKAIDDRDPAKILLSTTSLVGSILILIGDGASLILKGGTAAGRVGAAFLGPGWIVASAAMAASSLYASGTAYAANKSYNNRAAFIADGVVAGVGIMLAAVLMLCTNPVTLIAALVITILLPGPTAVAALYDMLELRRNLFSLGRKTIASEVMTVFIKIYTLNAIPVVNLGSPDYTKREMDALYVKMTGKLMQDALDEDLAIGYAGDVNSEGQKQIIKDTKTIDESALPNSDKVVPLPDAIYAAIIYLNRSLADKKDYYAKADSEIVTYAARLDVRKSIGGKADYSTSAFGLVDKPSSDKEMRTEIADVVGASIGSSISLVISSDVGALKKLIVRSNNVEQHGVYSVSTDHVEIYGGELANTYRVVESSAADVKIHGGKSLKDVVLYNGDEKFSGSNIINLDNFSDVSVWAGYLTPKNTVTGTAANQNYHSAGGQDVVSMTGGKGTAFVGGRRTTVTMGHGNNMVAVSLGLMIETQRWDASSAYGIYDGGAVAPPEGAQDTIGYLDGTNIINFGGALTGLTMDLVEPSSKELSKVVTEIRQGTVADGATFRNFQNVFGSQFGDVITVKDTSTLKSLLLGAGHNLLNISGATGLTVAASMNTGYYPNDINIKDSTVSFISGASSNNAIEVSGSTFIGKLQGDDKVSLDKSYTNFIDVSYGVGFHKLTVEGGRYAKVNQLADVASTTQISVADTSAYQNSVGVLENTSLAIFLAQDAANEMVSRDDYGLHFAYAKVADKVQQLDYDFDENTTATGAKRKAVIAAKSTLYSNKTLQVTVQALVSAMNALNIEYGYGVDSKTASYSMDQLYAKGLAIANPSL